MRNIPFDIFGLRKKGQGYTRRMLGIAIPIILQFAIGMSLNLVDSVMVGNLGVKELAGVGAANEVYYIIGITVYGMCSGTSVFVAQYWGARDIGQIRKTLGISYLCIGLFICIVTLISWMFSPQLVSLFSRDCVVIHFGTAYFRIVALSYPVTCIADIISFSSRAVQKLAVPTALSCSGMICNVALNYILIFGKAGFPAMGVKGAALATVISRLVVLTGLLCYIYIFDKEHPLAASFKELSSFKKEEIPSVLKVSMPVTISEGGWGLANALYFVAYGFIGPSALAAAQIVTLAGKICQSIFGGFSNAAAVLIGEELGKGNGEAAQKDGMIFIRIFFALGTVATTFMYFASVPIAAFYRFDTETTAMVVGGIRAFSGFIMLKMFGYLFVCGILRAGGDTHFCMMVDLGTSWLIGVPAAFISVMAFGVSLPVAIACVYTSEIAKAGLCAWRFVRGKWIRLQVGQSEIR